MAKDEINLLKATSSNAGKLALLERLLTKLTWWSLGILLSLGVVVGSVYLFAYTKQKQLEANKSSLLAAIGEQTNKEGILVSLKQRSLIASKALDAARPYGNLFPLLEKIAPSEFYTNLSIDDVGRSTVTLELPSVDEAVQTVANVLAQFDEKQLRNPQMLSFTLKDTGIVQLSLSFIANL